MAGTAPHPETRFIYQAQPARVVFGAGRLSEARAEAARLGVSRALVLSTPQQAADAERVAELLGPVAAGCFTGAAMHTPLEVTAAGMQAARRLSADGLVSIGGGSTVGLGKAIAMRTGMAHLAIPTTYAGSEVTPILGETENGIKTTRRAPGILPATVLYDPELTIGLPPGLSATSGLNAIAHAVEALYAPDVNPVVAHFARQGIAGLGAALPAILRDPADIGARTRALLGSWMCGTCLGSTAMALHHKLCHVLGGSFGLPHAETHAVILPHVVAYNRAAAPAAMADIAQALGAGEAAEGLYDLARTLRAPASLREIGLGQEDIAAAAALAAADPYANPSPVTQEGLVGLLRRAWEGAPPPGA